MKKKFGLSFKGADAPSTTEEIDPRCDARNGPGHCRIGGAKYLYHKDRKECIPKYLGDCSGDKNLFNTEDECKNACIQNVK